jgi:hypothetical protein
MCYYSIVTKHFGLPLNTYKWVSVFFILPYALHLSGFSLSPGDLHTCINYDTICVTMPYSPIEVHRCFEGIYCHHFQGWIVITASNHQYIRQNSDCCLPLVSWFLSTHSTLRGCEFLTVLVMDIASCSPLKDNWCCGGTCRLRLQVRKISEARNQ